MEIHDESYAIPHRMQIMPLVNFLLGLYFDHMVCCLHKYKNKERKKNKRYSKIKHHALCIKCLHNFLPYRWATLFTKNAAFKVTQKRKLKFTQNDTHKSSFQKYHGTCRGKNKCFHIIRWFL